MNKKFDDDDLLHVVETHPPDHQAYLAATKQMLDALPSDVKDTLHEEAMKILGSPKVDGYDKAGNPLWRSDTLAESAGVPIEDVERAAKLWGDMFGAVVPDEKVAVLKKPEPVYELTPKQVVLYTCLEYCEGNEKAIQFLGEWFDLGVSRGLKPIVVEQLKRVLDGEWTRTDIDPWLARIEQYSSCSEFVSDIMGITEWAS